MKLRDLIREPGPRTDPADRDASAAAAHPIAFAVGAGLTLLALNAAAVVAAGLLFRLFRVVAGV